jgi:putative zinc finger protein
MRERSMQHPEEGTIHAWLDGALSPSEAAHVEAHVASCEQCAAAVAEARGFIAGASRILTALDNVPSGVIPVATVRKPRNWGLWRAAAAIVVVALGSFVVLRDRIAGKPTDASDSVDTRTVISRPVSGPNSPELSQPQVEAQAVPAVSARTTAPARAPKAQPSSANEQRKVAADNAPQAAPSAAIAGTANSAERVGFAAGAAASTDARSSVSFLKNVGLRREIGRSSTLYEVSPGDTVVLSELSETHLGQVVVTGVQTTTQAAAVGTSRTLARAAAPDTQRREAAKSATKSSVTPAAQAAVAPAPAMAPAKASAAMADVANAYNTISWTDSATGKAMTLSGRHSVAELEEIRVRIERARAEQAPPKKKEP